MNSSHLNDVRENLHRPQRDPHAVDGVHERLYEMRRRLKHVWPDKVHEVGKGVLAPKAVHSQSHVLDGSARGLTMDKVAKKQR
jgi:hypothetical protein